MLAMLSETTRRPVWDAIMPEVAMLRMLFSDISYSPARSAKQERHDAALPGENCRAWRGWAPSIMCKPLNCMAFGS
jgi:hypothetical protein